MFVSGDNRVRPRLSHEQDLDYFESVLVSNPRVTVLEPGFSVKGEPKHQVSSYGVDLAFGPGDNNEVIYRAVVLPLVDLALQVTSGQCFKSAQGII